MLIAALFTRTFRPSCLSLSTFQIPLLPKHLMNMNLKKKKEYINEWIPKSPALFCN